MIPYVEPELTSVTNFYLEDYMTDEDLEQLVSLIEEGFDQEAFDLFINEYMIPPSIKFQDLMSDYLGMVETGPMREKDKDALSRNITLMNLGLSAVLLNNFSKYLNSSYSKNIFEGSGITDAMTKKAILVEVETVYEQLLSGSLSRTQSFILSSLRTMQRELIAENLLLKNSKLTGEAIENEIIRFKNSLRIKYPEIYKAINKGNVLVTSRFIDGAESIRHYKLDYYIDLVTRTAILDVDRNSNMISALASGERVVNFYLSDPRQVKKDREICQEILATLTLGESILALDAEAASILGIMTVDEAKSTPDYSFGPYCRHSVKRCSAEYIKQINDLLGAKNGN
jgi:hypothetical protein